MPRLAALALIAAPLALLPLPLIAPPALAQGATLAQVQSHLRAVSTMQADFTETDRTGRSVSGQVSLKRPGRIRFQYQRGVNKLIVSDGRALTFVDYEVNQVQRWPIGDSPLGVLLNPERDMSRFAEIVSGGSNEVRVRARDPEHPEYGVITIFFARDAGAPGGLMLEGWTVRDSQNNLTAIRLSNQRFGMAIPDSTFRFRDPRPRNRRR